MLRRRTPDRALRNLRKAQGLHVIGAARRIGNESSGTRGILLGVGAEEAAAFANVVRVGTTSEAHGWSGSRKRAGGKVMRVPFVDLKAQAESLGETYGSLLQSIVSRAAYTMGPELAQFEEEFAAYCDCEHAVGVSSGTDALKLAYLAAGVRPGDEVILPVNTFIATAEAVSHIGARPVFVDCLAETANIDPGLIEAAITDRTRAIVPVHLYGQPADMDAIQAVADDRGSGDRGRVPGARCRVSRSRGGARLAAAFSFYPGKNLGALGRWGSGRHQRDGCQRGSGFFATTVRKTSTRTGSWATATDSTTCRRRFSPRNSRTWMIGTRRGGRPRPDTT